MIHEQQMTVRYAETGVGGFLKPANIFNYFQDIASDHSALMGVSAYDLLPRDLAWVIHQYQIVIHRYPAWKNRLKLRTWRCPFKNLYELRHYEITDAEGNLLIVAKSSWVLTHIVSKKPVRLNKHLPPEMIEDLQIPIADDFTPIPDISVPGWSRTFRARMHDLDFNRHVNNSVYAVWGMESLPADILQTCRPTRIAIIYIGESRLGDPVTVHTQQVASDKNIAFLHSIVNETTGKEITRLQTQWEFFCGSNETREPPAGKTL